MSLLGWAAFLLIFWKPISVVGNWLGNYPLPEWLNTVAMLFLLGVVPYLAILGLSSVGSVLIYHFVLLTT